MANEKRVLELRPCRKCGTEKPLSQDCKPCKSARARRRYQEQKTEHAAKGRAYYQANRDAVLARAKRRSVEKRDEIAEYQRNYRLMRYGLTLADYKAMLASQNGTCFVCKRAEMTVKNLPVDHDHDTGKVRKLLCTACNTALGLLGDDVTLLRALADYVEAHRE